MSMESWCMPVAYLQKRPLPAGFEDNMNPINIVMAKNN
jgi:hypothetical protein